MIGTVIRKSRNEKVSYKDKLKKGKKEMPWRDDFQELTPCQIHIFFLGERKGWSGYKVQRCGPVDTVLPARLAAPSLQCSTPFSLKSRPPPIKMDRRVLTQQPYQGCAPVTQRHRQSLTKPSAEQCLNTLSQPAESTCLLLQNARQRSQKHPCPRAPPKQANPVYSDLQKECVHTFNFS